jgi:hypothetical protein
MNIRDVAIVLKSFPLSSDVVKLFPVNKFFSQIHVISSNFFVNIYKATGPFFPRLLGHSQEHVPFTLVINTLLHSSPRSCSEKQTMASLTAAPFEYSPGHHHP